jgi:hypothetical protein
VNLIFACPSYGPLEPDVVIGQRLAIMHAAKHGGVTWVGDCSPNDVKLSTIDAARNRIVTEALQSDAHAIFWCDSDVVLPPHAITALVGATHEFVTGIYHQRAAPFYPVIARFDPDPAPHGQMRWIVGWPENVVAPIDGCGFGVALTGLALLRRMTAPWFAFTHFSEDFTFCQRAAAAGGQLYVHTGVLCGHIGPRATITVETFRAAWQDGGAALGRDSAA